MERLVPAVAGWGVVASGFGLMTGASDGCGGGVARCRSSLSVYRPSPTRNWYSGPEGCVRILLVSIMGAT